MAGFPFFEDDGQWYVLNNLIVAWGNARYIAEPGRTELRTHILAAYKTARRLLRDERRMYKRWEIEADERRRGTPA